MEIEIAHKFPQVHILKDITQRSDATVMASAPSNNQQQHNLGKVVRSIDLGRMRSNVFLCELMNALFKLQVSRTQKLVTKSEREKSLTTEEKSTF